MLFYYSQSWEGSSLPRCSIPPGSESCTRHCSLFTSAQAGAATCIQRLLASSAFLFLFSPSTRTFPVIKRYARAYTPRLSFHWSTTWEDEDCRNRGLHLNPYLLLFSISIVFHSLRPYGLKPDRLLCSWDFPGKNTGVDCPFLLQGIFQTQGWNQGLLQLLPWQADSFITEPRGKPRDCTVLMKQCLFKARLRTGSYLAHSRFSENVLIFLTAWVIMFREKTAG